MTDLETLCLGVVGAGAVLKLAKSIRRPRRRRKAKGDRLDRPVLYWTDDDPHSMRNLLDGGCCILGRPGSAKTTGSGKAIREGVVGYPGSGGLILSSAATDLPMWQETFAKKGRKDDLIVFGPKHNHRFNMIDFLSKIGCDDREVAKAIITIGESLDNDDTRSGGGDGDKFWPMQTKAGIETAVTATRLADGAVSIPNIHKFILTAARSPAELEDEGWKERYHNQSFRKAYERGKTPEEEGDYELASDRWLLQWPAMNDRTRSSVEACMTGPLHVFNSGVIRSLLSKDTTVTPEVMNDGKWVFVDMSVGENGTSGAFGLNMWRYATQKYVLHRDPARWVNPIIIWADEAGKVVNSNDSYYLTESRKFGGASVFLAQSMQSFHAALPGERGKAQAELLLGCFATKVLHACDPTTAEWASRMCGNELKMQMGFSPMNHGQFVYDMLMGQGMYSVNGHQHMGPVLEAKEFMHGLRTGGAANSYIADAIVVRSGESFAWGGNYLLCSFRQK